MLATLRKGICNGAAHLCLYLGSSNAGQRNNRNEARVFSKDDNLLACPVYEQMKQKEKTTRWPRGNLIFFHSAPRPSPPLCEAHLVVEDTSPDLHQSRQFE